MSTNFEVERPFITKRPELCNVYPNPTAPDTSTTSTQEVSTRTTHSLLTPEDPPPDGVRPPPNVNNVYPYEMYFSRRNERQPLPCHAKNPVVERNTHKRSDEDLEFEGNAVVRRSERQEEEEAVEPQPPTEDTTRREVAPRIPYLHNDVASEPISVRPKQPNMPVYNKSSEKHKKNLLGWIPPRLKRPFARGRDVESGESPAAAQSSSSLQAEPQRTSAPRPRSLGVVPDISQAMEEQDKCNLNKANNTPAGGAQIMPSPFRADSEPLI